VRAKSTSPVLSETDKSARVMRLGSLGMQCSGQDGGRAIPRLPRRRN
jgi:hypothetical protein